MDALTKRLERDAKLLRALIQAEHALTCIEGAIARFPDEKASFPIDNAATLKQLEEAIALLGLDPHEPRSMIRKG